MSAARSRADARFVTPRDYPTLELRSADMNNAVIVQNISAGGILYRATAGAALGSGRYTLIRRSADATHNSDQRPSQRDRVLLTAVATDFSPPRAVLRVRSGDRERVRRFLMSMVGAGDLISSNHARRSLEQAEIEELMSVLKSCDELSRDTQDSVLAWIKVNQERVSLLGPDAWPLISKSLKTTFTKFYVGPRRFARYLKEALSSIRTDEYDEYHVVPMRMLDGLSRILVGHRSVIEQQGFSVHDSLWGLLHNPPSGAGSKRSCLVALDTYVNEGISRRQFLRLFAAFPELKERFAAVILVAVVGREDAFGYDAEATPLRDCGIRVDSVFGLPLGADSRSNEWAAFLAGLGEERFERPPGFLMFDYGAPFDSVPVYWREGPRWIPLCRPLEYYNPGHRPRARAPLFSAYPRTLNTLQRMLTRGGAALLYGPRGYGKTYLAARLVETSRSSSYVFWHQCRRFDSLESLVENLDVFLQSLGVQNRLSSHLYKPLGEADVAEQCVRSLRLLDRPVLLVFDGAEQLDLLGAPEGRFSSVVLFIRHLVAAATTRQPPAISEPLVLLTHEEPSQNGGEVVRPGGKLTTVGDLLCESLGLSKSDLVRCPIDGKDNFNDASELVRRVLRDPAAIESYAEKINLLAHFSPYKAWLLCYWINRCVRLAGDELTDSARQAIDEVVHESFAQQYSDVNAIHSRISARLLPNERHLLEVASAWRLPWLSSELADIKLADVPGLSKKDTLEILNTLSKDRSPFIVRLERPVPDDQRGPVTFTSSPADPDSQRYEMPSISAAFFRRHLESRAHMCDVYRGMASVIDTRLQRIPSDSATLANRVLQTTLEIEAILYLCAAKRPEDAANRFSSDEPHRRLRALNSWDRLLQIGGAILDAAQQSGSNKFHSDDWRRFVVVHANALADSLHLEEARKACDEGLRAKEHDYWYWRLRLIKAKCLRLDNRFNDSLAEMAEIATGFRDLAGRSPEPHHGAFWAARTEMAKAVCLMSLGRLPDAEQALAAVNALEHRVSGRDLDRLKGITLRHRGTLQLLRGNLTGDGDSADSLFKEFEAGATKAHLEDSKRIESIAKYKRARVLLEVVREYEAPLRWQRSSEAPTEFRELNQLALEGVPPENDVFRQLKDARAMLADAWSLLSQSERGDRKWFPAIELGDADARLIARRIGLDEERPTEFETERIEHRLDQVERRLPPERPEARGMEISALKLSLEWEKELEQSDAEIPPYAVSLREQFADAEAKRDQRSAADLQPLDDGSNPYKRSRGDYEAMYYLWRAIEKAPSELIRGKQIASRDNLTEAAAYAYRRGTTTLYAHGMARSASALHRLALVCFANWRLGLQERLEAATCLGLDPEKSVCLILDRIALEALQSEPTATDRFFTIPTKVICRLYGAHRLYAEVAKEGRQPAGLPPKLPDWDQSLATLAKMLAINCRDWCVNVNWARLSDLAQLAEPSGSSRRSTNEERARKLERWLKQLLTQGN